MFMFVLFLKYMETDCSFVLNGNQDLVFQHLKFLSNFSQNFFLKGRKFGTQVAIVRGTSRVLHGFSALWRGCWSGLSRGR